MRPTPAKFPPSASSGQKKRCRAASSEAPSDDEDAVDYVDPNHLTDFDRNCCKNSIYTCSLHFQCVLY